MVRRLLDLFCGGGGASAGYALAGFDVVGVDLALQPRYPFLELYQGDALDFLDDRAFLDDFDAVHASPPCQAYTSLRGRHRGRVYPDLVAAVRDRLQAWGGPYIIENVVGAPLVRPVMLCGSMFGLGYEGAVLRRHRLFESNQALRPPGPDACAGRRIVGVYGNGGAWTRTAPGGGGAKIGGRAAAAALGIEWTDHQPVLSQAIPPAYTAWLGTQLLDQLAAA